MTEAKSNKKYQGKFTLVFSWVLIAAGLGLIALFALNQRSVHTPIDSARASSATPTKSNHLNKALVMPTSQPVVLEIPAIDVQSPLLTLGKNMDGTIAVPSPDDADKAAWYEYSPTPGQQGSSVIVGHVDNVEGGAGVFFRLGDLKPNDEVKVRRADGKTAVFKVDAVNVYAKDNFPTEKIYGDTEFSALNLITCGGTFNGETGEYESNIVAFTSLVRTE